MSTSAKTKKIVKEQAALQDLFPKRNKAAGCNIWFRELDTSRASYAMIHQAARHKGLMYQGAELRMGRLYSKMLQAGKLKPDTVCGCCGKPLSGFVIGSIFQNMTTADTMQVYPLIGGQMATVDHIIPQTWGGTDHPDNLQLTCFLCNNTKGDYVTEEDIAKVKGRWAHMIDLTVFVGMARGVNNALARSLNRRHEKLSITHTRRRECGRILMTAMHKDGISILKKKK